MKKIIKITIGALIVTGLLFGASSINTVKEKAADTYVVNIKDPGQGGGGM